MKQRIRVVGIVKTKDGILLLKRLRGRSEELPLWELPTGKIRFGEQPEEALARAMYEFLGVEVKSVTLADAVSFASLSGASQMGNLYIVYNVELIDGKITLLDRYSAYKYVKDEETVALAVDEASLSVLSIMKSHKSANANVTTDEGAGRESARAAISGATLYVDGGSRGNPGPAGIGYYLLGEDGNVISRGGKFIGFATSRMAEYYALRYGIRQAIEKGLKRVRIVSDSLMMVNHMNGIYGIKNQDLIPVYNDIQELLKEFDSVAFVHRKREFNVEADAEVNKAIDEHFRQ